MWHSTPVVLCGLVRTRPVMLCGLVCARPVECSMCALVCASHVVSVFQCAQVLQSGQRFCTALCSNVYTVKSCSNACSRVYKSCSAVSSSVYNSCSTMYYSVYKSCIDVCSSVYMSCRALETLKYATLSTSGSDVLHIFLTSSDSYVNEKVVYLVVCGAPELQTASSVIRRSSPKKRSPVVSSAILLVCIIPW